MPHHTDTIADWLISNRLYEDNLFYYTLIICFWFFIGFIFLGFEINGYSQAQNLFFNFIYYLIICACMAFCPFWFKFFFSKTHTAKREQELNAHLNELDDDDRQEVVAYLNETGQLAMRPAQRWALVFLGSYFLFEVFFISAWVKDLTLVWQPDWVMGIVEWVRENTALPPIHENHGLFYLDFSLSSDKILHTMYTTETEFLNSEFGKTALFFHFIRFANVSLITIAICLSFLDIIGWSGLKKFTDSDNKDYDLFAFLKSYLWTSFLAFFCALMIIGGIFGLWRSIKTSAEMSMNIVMWLDNLYLNFCLALMIISFFIIVSWLKMSKLLILGVIDFIKQFF